MPYVNIQPYISYLSWISIQLYLMFVQFLYLVFSNSPSDTFHTDAPAWVWVIHFNRRVSQGTVQLSRVECNPPP